MSEETVLSLIELYPSSPIEETFIFAKQCHQGQKRLSGEDFIEHPLAVAKIVADEGLSGATVQAALLHDVIEDSDCDRETISEKFGEEIAQIVEGLTKISSVSPRKSVRRHRLASYRKLLIAAADDARVLVIKLADRLHNMRTISALPASRQLQFATETAEIYAPLAHRLGMGKIKDELADRSLAILDPRAYLEAGELLQTRIKSGAGQRQQLKEIIEEALEANQIKGTVEDRVKSKSSIAAKLARSEGSKVWDIIGLRILVDDLDSCYRALGIVHGLWPPSPERIKDWIAMPRANRYQALHTTVIVEGKPVEVQIRTHEQHAVAEHGIAAHWLYKENLSEGGPQQKFIADLAIRQEEARDLEESFKQLKRDIFAEEIYLFTPKGEVKILPAGSCAIDFAYEVHSGLGEKSIGARVNNKIAPLTRPLQSGEVVEIISGERNGPSLDWLASVKTSKARSQIKHFHQTSLDREKIEKGFTVLGQQILKSGLVTIQDRAELEKALKRAGLDPDQAALSSEKSESNRKGIIKTLVRSLANNTAPAQPSKRGAHTAGAGVSIDGLEGVDFRLAGCCSPEPGDSISGFVSLARGVVIHHRNCPNLQAQKRKNKARIVSARWKTGNSSYRSQLALSFLDRPLLLKDLADAVAASGAEIIELELKTSGQVVRGQLIAAVSSPEQSKTLREEIENIDSLLTINRKTPMSQQKNSQPKKRRV